MEIRYQNTFADLIKFNMYLIPRMLFIRIGSLILLILISWPVFKTWQKTEASVLALVVLLLINAALAALFMSVSMLILTTLMYLPRLNKAFLTEHILSVSEAGLVEETEFNRTEYKWPGITKISQSRHYIFIFVSQYGAHVVPKRAFADATHSDTFFSTIRNLWQAAQRG